jgi:hypothetical protein
MTRTVALAIALTTSALAVVFVSARTLASPPGIEGTIMATDAAEQRIRVADDKTEYWFQCTPSTTITLNGYAATFNQLAAGQKAKVVYDPAYFEALQVDAMPR